MECVLPILFILNVDGSLISQINPDYKTPNRYADIAKETCEKKVGTCPESVGIFPDGIIFIKCKEKK